MAFWSNWFGGRKSPAAAPRASLQGAGGGLVLRTRAEFEEALRTGSLTASGTRVTPDTAMGVAAVYASIRIIAGAVATLPLHIKRRVDARTREDASDTPIWALLRRQPNRWQTPSQFRRMLQAHLLLRGNRTRSQKSRITNGFALMRCREIARSFENKVTAAKSSERT